MHHLWQHFEAGRLDVTQVFHLLLPALLQPQRVEKNDFASARLAEFFMGTRPSPNLFLGFYFDS